MSTLTDIAKQREAHPLDALVDMLWMEATRRWAGKLPSSSTIGTRLKATMKRLGIKHTVFGDGDEKTGSPGWYRSVGTVENGGTCPSRCEHLASRSCYALYSHVGHLQHVSGNDRRAALHAAAASMVWAAATNRQARGHVSGDLGGDAADDIDMLYVEGLARIARRVREKLGQPDAIIAWSYTHHDPEHPNTKLAIAQLADAGVVVRLSDHLDIGGTVTVASRDHARELRESSGKRVAVCPAQLTDKSCSQCKLCWERPGVVVAFVAHGNGRKRAESWSKEVFGERGSG